MTEGFRVEFAHLRKHTATVDGLMRRANKAVEAAQHVTQLDDAYGDFCKIWGLPEKMREPQEAATTYMLEVANRLERALVELGNTADDYEAKERDLQEQLWSIMKRLDEKGGAR